MSTGKATPGLSKAEKAALESQIDKLARRIKELKNFDPSGIQERWDPRIEAFQKQINNTLADIFGSIRSPEYKQYAMGALDEEMESVFGDRYSSNELRQTIRKSLD